MLWTSEPKKIIDLHEIDESIACNVKSIKIAFPDLIHSSVEMNCLILKFQSTSQSIDQYSPSPEDFALLHEEDTKLKACMLQKFLHFPSLICMESYLKAAIFDHSKIRQYLSLSQMKVDKKNWDLTVTPVTIMEQID